MRFLVSNDDGIQAEGIIQLASSLSKVGEVIVVAPDMERSASSHAITIHLPLRVREVRLPGLDIKAYSVNGTPADCVKIGIDVLLKDKPDFVFTGINRGANLGTDVLYSGTVSAAIEGCIMGVRAVALSLLYGDTMDYTYAGQVAQSLAQALMQQELHSNFLLNVNIPNAAENDIKGVKVTHLGTRRYTKNYEMRKDPRGGTYFWLAGELADEKTDLGSDIEVTSNNYISITPLHFDLTSYSMIDELKRLELKL